MQRRLTFFVGILFLVVTFFPIAFAEDTQKISTIEVVGQAKIMAKPNMAILSFTAETNAKKAEDAVKENAERTERLLKTLRDVLTKEEKLKTSGYTLFPVYEKGNRTHPAGYRVRNTVTVETKDLGKLGTLIDEASRVGVSRIGRLTFRNDKEEEIRGEVAAEAVNQAIKTAESLAKAAGLTIRRIVKVSYSPQQPTPSPLYGREAGLAGARTPIEIGEIPIEASVTVVFEVD